MTQALIMAVFSFTAFFGGLIAMIVYLLCQLELALHKHKDKKK